MLRTIARTTDVEPGHVRAFEVRDDGAEAVGRSRIPLLKTIGVGRSKETRITIANVAGTLSAIDDTCTHRGCSLGDGKLDGSTVQCACHGSRFDVTSGAVVHGPAEDPVRASPFRSPTARSRSTCSWPHPRGSEGDDGTGAKIGHGAPYRIERADGGLESTSSPRAGQ